MMGDNIFLENDTIFFSDTLCWTGHSPCYYIDISNKNLGTPVKPITALFSSVNVARCRRYFFQYNVGYKLICFVPSDNPTKHQFWQINTAFLPPSSSFLLLPSSSFFFIPSHPSFLLHPPPPSPPTSSSSSFLLFSVVSFTMLSRTHS